MSNSLVDAALLDQMRRIIEQDPRTLPRSPTGPPRGLRFKRCTNCKKMLCKSGRPNVSGYCSLRECRNAKWRQRYLENNR